MKTGACGSGPFLRAASGGLICFLVCQQKKIKDTGAIMVTFTEGEAVILSAFASVVGKLGSYTE